MKEGWEFKKIKEIGRTQTGTTPSKSEKSFYGGDIPFIRPAELDIDGNGAIKYDSELKLTQEGALKSRIISANSILMCCIGSVGKTGYSIKEVTCNQQINTITPYDSCNGKFVYYALLAPSFQNEVIKIANSAKATLAIISKGKWEEMSIPVAPLSEQQQIVDRLDSALAKIDAVKANAEKQLNDAKTLFKKELSKAMMPKEGWERKKLGDIALDMYRGFGIRRDQVTEDGVPCVRYGEIYTTYNVSFDTCISHTKEEFISSPKYFENGDLLFAITGESVEDIGKTIAYLGNERCLLGGDIICMKHEQNPKFLAYALSTTDAIKQKGMGKTKLKVVHTNAPALKAISIPIPPLSVQQAIVTHLDTLSEKLKAVEEKQKTIMAECDAMKQALLREVFE